MQKNILSSQFSNIRRTRFDQSSPVKPVSEIQKSKKKSKNSPQKKLKKKKNCRKEGAILPVFQYQEDVIRPEISSPACFRIHGTLSVTEESEQTNKQTESSCLIQDATKATLMKPQILQQQPVMAKFWYRLSSVECGFSLLQQTHHRIVVALGHTKVVIYFSAEVSLYI